MEEITLETPDQYIGSVYDYDELHSFTTEAPFTNCISCNRELIDTQADYVVEKGVRNYVGTDVKDVIFDYAMCMSCASQLQEQLSVESRSAIQNYFMENMESLLSTDVDIKTRFSKCLFSHKDLSTTTEYQLVALCKGDKIMSSPAPYAISNEEVEKIQALISQATRDELDDFTDKHFGGPPAFKELLKQKLILV